MSETIHITLQPDDGTPTRYEVPAGVYTIGRDDDCKICLPGGLVSPRHAILTVSAGESWIEDLASDQGTYANGDRVEGRVVIGTGTPIRIGPYTIFVEPQQPLPAPPPGQPPAAGRALPSAPRSRSAPHTYQAESVERRNIKQTIHKELITRLDIKRLTASRVRQDELRERAASITRTIVGETSASFPPDLDPDLLIKEICDEALGLGPIENYLDDPEITEIMVNGPNHVYYEKNGKLIKSPQQFMNAESVMAIIERIVSPIGRRIDESQPYVDARLPDGSRVNAIIHPLSLIGPCLTIRKFSKRPFTTDDLIRLGSMAPAMVDFASICVRLRKNIVVSGGTGSGKTTFLNVLSSFLPDDERIITIEDAAELRLTQEHVIRLEARPPNIEGRGAISIRDLVRNSLRMRPDRVVVGECRGGEALDMLQAMNTGHDGSLTTVHANSPRDVISRLETMVLMSGMDLPLRAIREQIAAAVDIIIHTARMSDGSRRVTCISEVVGLEGPQITMQDVFVHEQTGVDANGKVLGLFRPTGAIPTFLEDIASRGLSIDRSMFNPKPGGAF